MPDVEKINNIAVASIQKVNDMTVGGAGSGSGGTETTVGSYSVHTYESTANFVWTAGAGEIQGINGVSPAGGSDTIDVLYVAGGGGGGGKNAGGGGGGGFRVITGQAISAGTHSVQIGGGGAGHASGNGADGGDSSFNSVTLHGGGNGATSTYDGGDSTTG